MSPHFFFSLLHPSLHSNCFLSTLRFVPSTTHSFHPLLLSLLVPFTLVPFTLAPFTPRSFHPRSFHPRSFHPRSFNPRSFHSSFLSPSFLSLLVPFTLVPFTLVPFTLVSFTLRTFSPSFFPSLVPLTLSSSQTSFAAHFVSSLLSLFLPYRTSLLTLRTLHPPVPTNTIPLPPPSFYCSFLPHFVPITPYSFYTLCLPSLIPPNPFFLQSQVLPTPFFSESSLLPLFIPPMATSLLFFSSNPTSLPRLSLPRLSLPRLSLPRLSLPLRSRFSSCHFFCIYASFPLLSPFPFLMFIYSLPKANRWRKRGISLVPLKYGITWENSRFTAYVAIFRKDGTVSITHGGIEMGQGINTKVYIHHPTCHHNPEIISNYVLQICLDVIRMERLTQLIALL